MQSKRKIRQLLCGAGLRPNRTLGQHFLVDLNLVRRLVELANLGGQEVVLEVGCGTGSLTEALAEKAGWVIGVEVDSGLAKIARDRLKAKPNVEIITADILRAKNSLSPRILDALASAGQERRPILLVANLPYNVASPVMWNLVVGPVVAGEMYVTVQKEIAERMAAAPGGKEYGGVSILLQATGQVHIERVLKPTVFWPQPKVDSAMVSFRRCAEKVGQIGDMQLFTEVIRLFMGHRRKMVRTCAKFAGGRLREIQDWAMVFDRCGIEAAGRPERIAPADYVALANMCAQQLRDG